MHEIGLLPLKQISGGSYNPTCERSLTPSNLGISAQAPPLTGPRTISRLHARTRHTEPWSAQISSPWDSKENFSAERF